MSVLPVSFIVVSTSDAPPPVNRRLALAALGLGVFAPSVLAACSGTVAKQAHKNKEQSAPNLKYQPADAAADVV
ncbi:L,D-transpeptidase, partial [Mycobacterium montefiorense]